MRKLLFIIISLIFISCIKINYENSICEVTDKIYKPSYVSKELRTYYDFIYDEWITRLEDVYHGEQFIINIKFNDFIQPCNITSHDYNNININDKCSCRIGYIEKTNKIHHIIYKDY